MTVEQILALSGAGFSAEQITNMISALVSAQPEQQEQQEAPQEQPEQQEQQEAPKEQEQQEQPAQEDATPAWFNKFLQKYNADYEQIARGIQAKNVRRAGSDDPGAPLKTPEQLMAEAYNNIR